MQFIHLKLEWYKINFFVKGFFQAYRKKICAVILMDLPDRYASYTNAPNSILSLIDAGTSQHK